jgi:hypothetical protein
MYIICEKNFEEQKRFSCGRKKIARLSEIFGLLWDRRERKKHTLFFVSFSRTLSLSGVLSDRLSRRINQISLHLLSRKSIALFHKGVFIYQNAVISVILLSSRHRRERERAESANTLSLKKRDRGLNPVDHKSTIKERACVVCDRHRLAREEYISLI